MREPFFIMLFDQGGESARPIVDDDNDVMFFETRQMADDAMDGHFYAEAFGYEIHEIGNNEH